jgi:predicted aconitase with swiveling domain
VGCIISDIPAVDKVSIERIKTGDQLRVDATQNPSTVEIK